ncbi:MAG: hypothetical protein LC754_09690 [Acidobacteria bacterium]|nr:hypothetical protein [Acidobacteriota bacterium]
MATAGSVIIVLLLLLTLVRWMLMGKLGFLMVGMTLCVTASMVCGLNLKGQQRYWAILPVTLFFIFVVQIFRVWNRDFKK